MISRKDEETQNYIASRRTCIGTYVPTPLPRIPLRPRPAPSQVFRSYPAAALGDDAVDDLDCAFRRVSCGFGRCRLTCRRRDVVGRECEYQNKSHLGRVPTHLLQRKLFSRSDRVKGVDFHPTEPWLLTGLYNGTVNIYNLETGSIVKTFEVSEVPVRCVKFIPRKNWFIAGSDDFQLRVFNYNTHEKVAAFEAHPDYIRCLTVHPTASIVLTGSDDMTIRAWDWDKQWRCMQVRVHSDGCYALYERAFAADLRGSHPLHHEHRNQPERPQHLCLLMS